MSRFRSVSAAEGRDVSAVDPATGSAADPRLPAGLPTGVTGVVLDSRQVGPGDLYVALPGTNTHGARFAAAARDAGALAVLTDPAGAALIGELDIPVLQVADPRAVMGPLAAVVHGEPAQRLRLVAVTGTNGKTTTAHLIEAGLRAVGDHVGVIGTNGFAVDGRPLDRRRTTVTTPESPDLHALLADMAGQGAVDVVMEVSSIAMAYQRTAGARFEVSAFTNLGRDHLDFHADMEEYFEAKASLFTPEHSRRAVVVIGDGTGEYGQRLADRITAAGELPLLTVGAPEADYHPLEVRTENGRTEILAATPHGELRFSTPLPGRYNVRNALTALACVDSLGLDIGTAARGLASATVPGRMQPVVLSGDAPQVFVDFAHTPQAVEAALTAAGEGGRRVIAVLGCGGDRDREKRGPMGAAAARRAAVVLITDDNPRTEDPAAIRAAALTGAREAVDQLADEGREVDLRDAGDRRSAIRTALALAAPGDVVAVLGKGHEQGQEIAGEVRPFDDATVIAECWSALSEGERP
ncbi:UDP-N-acetylmuramoyl-L-alanyl-D-glutamate--2,6-diaminopimelate ligase [Naumannella halotolerans]|uniref:UDP-N-acetylmuramoyl-L-alanyl-D-glutamate--2, 6-diaminopimelate ligase n=1 Tax=Naumannella halotolerans TaxID=993414 RepID=UPI00370D2712